MCASSAGYIAIAMAKTEYDDFVYEDMASNTVYIPAAAHVAINLFDDEGNLLSYSDASQPFNITFQVKVIFSPPILFPTHPLISPFGIANYTNQ